MCCANANWALYSVPSSVFVEVQLAGPQHENLRLAIALNGDGYLLRVAEALKNLCCLLRVGQSRTVNILDEVTRSQPERCELLAIAARINTLSLHLAGYVVRRRPDAVSQFSDVSRDNILNASRVRGGAADSGRIATNSPCCLGKILRQLQDFERSAAIQDNSVCVHSV